MASTCPAQPTSMPHKQVAERSRAITPQVLAGSLRDNKRAVLIGTTTFGKGGSTGQGSE
jgi:hypothetical protein